MERHQKFQLRKGNPFPTIPQIIVQEPYNFERPYNFGGSQANRNAYAGSDYQTPNWHRSLGSRFNYQFPSTEFYTPPTPIDRAYQISRLTNCMGPAPRLPGLLPCPYGTDAIACADHAA